MFTDLWAGNQDFAEGRGNNREVQPINKHRLYYKGATEPEPEGPISDETPITEPEPEENSSEEAPSQLSTIIIVLLVVMPTLTIATLGGFFIWLWRYRRISPEPSVRGSFEMAPQDSASKVDAE